MLNNNSVNLKVNILFSKSQNYNHGYIGYKKQSPAQAGHIGGHDKCIDNLECHWPWDCIDLPSIRSDIEGINEVYLDILHAGCQVDTNALYMDDTELWY